MQNDVCQSQDFIETDTTWSHVVPLLFYFLLYERALCDVFLCWNSPSNELNGTKRPNVVGRNKCHLVVYFQGNTTLLENATWDRRNSSDK